MSESPSLGLPYLAASQAQKHLTHNEALSMLDGLIHLAVVSRALATPPASPADGDRYLVAGSPSGDWAGHAGEVALRMEGAWRFFTPREGWRLWLADEDALIVYDGAAWNEIGVPSELQNLALLGVNATADVANKFAVASAATLFNHVGGGHQVKLNKNAPGDTASFLFQTGFSGRAEFGATGDDDFHLKVSPDGSAWSEALVISRTSALTTIKNALRLEPQASDPASPADGQVWYNSTSGKFRAREAGASKDVIGGSGGGGAAWGAITGTLSAQTDLQSALDGKSAVGHGHTSGAITDFTEAAQDAVGAAFDTTLSYNDAGNAMGRAAITGHISIPAGANSAALSSFTMAELDAAVSDGNVSYAGHTHSGLAPAGGTAGQVLKKISATDYDYSWQADSGGGSGSGDVVGPGSATDNAIARFDGATGKLLQNSAPSIDDNGTLSFVAGDTGFASANIPAAAALRTAPAAGDIERDGNCVYMTTDAGNRGVNLIEHFIRAASARTLTSTTSAQALFDSPANGALTLETGTYFFEGLFSLTAMSGTSGNAMFSLLGAGTATLTNVLYNIMGIDNVVNAAGTQTGSTVVQSNSPASAVTATTQTQMQANLRGTFEVTAAGTIIPSIALVTAAVAQLRAGSYFRFRRVGAMGVVSVGQWS